jgi:hypothetical protein
VTLAETLDRADRVLRDIWDAIEGPLRIEDHLSRLLISYLSLALEHQEGILTLIRNHLRGSALALVRPVFEIFCRSFWVVDHATPEDVEKIWGNEFHFPSLGEMASNIDAIVGDSTFQNIKQLSWKDQNELTHSGGFQIRSRFTRETLESSYPEDIIIGHVNATIQVALMLATLTLRKQNRIEDAGRLEVLMSASHTDPDNFSGADPAAWVGSASITASPRRGCPFRLGSKRS